MAQQSDRNNRANQLNQNNDAYWHSRGEDERPDDWEERERGGDKSPRGRGPARKG